jgi:hypothetical protein
VLHGFYISQFRNFGDEPQAVGPLAKINIFIGGNNSGKSNILRFIRDILPLLFKRDKKISSAYSGINRSRFTHRDQASIHVLVPIDETTLAQVFPASRPAIQEQWLEFFRSLPSFEDGHIAIPLLKAPQTSIWVDKNALDAAGVNQAVAQQIWHTTGQSGGSFSEHWYPQILQRLFEKYNTGLDWVYVPAFRQIDTKLDEFSHEYRKSGGEHHIIDELAEIASPRYDEQEKKESFEKLRCFIGDIANRPDIRIDIPHDRSTINVNFDGHVVPIEALGSGIHELFMLASRIVLNEGKAVLLEEPEVHLHPEFQRKFMIFLRDQINSQFFISTHSAVVIDTDGAKVFGVWNAGAEARVEALLADQTRREMCREMGYRPSDLLQANSIIWVEGRWRLT